MQPSRSTSEQIRLEQVRLLYHNSTSSILLSFLGGLLLCWTQWPVIGHATIGVWLALFFVVYIVRVFLIFQYKKNNISDRSPDRWHNRFVITTYIVGGLWGAASLYLFPLNSHLHQAIFFIIITGMTASAVSALSPSLATVVGFLSLALLPLIAKMVFIGSTESYYLGLLVIIFWLVNLFNSKKINASIHDNIRLRLQGAERERILSTSEERYRHIFDNAPLGIFHYNNDAVVIDANDTFINIIETTRDFLIGFNMLTMMKDQKMLQVIKKALKTGDGYFEGDYTTITSGKTTPIRIFFKAIRSSDDTIIGGVGIVEDFTERKRAEQQIKYHATYDFLTGLPNRRLLLYQLDNEIARARRHNHHGALLFIDLDNFKTINDSLGHSVGDKLLKLVAARIKEFIRQEDSAARMGGDEFTIILTHLNTTAEPAANKAREIAEELSLCLSNPCQIEGQTLHITPSVGVSLFPKEGAGADEILKQADTAMYRAKAAGRNEIRFFLPSMQEAANERLRLNTELRQALDRNEFAIYYQPQVEQSGNIIGAEALLRWHHPERGVIPPGLFLRIAEETGLMVEIGRWVLRTACLHIREWTASGLLKDSIVVAVNISGKEFAAPDFIDGVVTVLQETGASPDHLGIELTEGSLISTGDDIVEKITRLRKMGVKFSVDDFGTGYSSLSYLNKLPLNTLKIDRSFVNDIKDAEHSVVLVDTIIMMTQNLGLEVIAEGVETEEELRYLAQRGCDKYQGYYFSRPVPVETFTSMLSSGNCRLTG
jgi:diguanylate cyclase (GGDEF)-like protein/PAS domain S-box-containing protein